MLNKFLSKVGDLVEKVETELKSEDTKKMFDNVGNVLKEKVVTVTESIKNMEKSDDVDKNIVTEMDKSPSDSNVKGVVTEEVVLDDIVKSVFNKELEVNNIDKVVDEAASNVKVEVVNVEEEVEIKNENIEEIKDEVITVSDVENHSKDLPLDSEKLQDFASSSKANILNVLNTISGQANSKLQQVFNNVKENKDVIAEKIAEKVNETKEDMAIKAEEKKLEYKEKTGKGLLIGGTYVAAITLAPSITIAATSVGAAAYGYNMLRKVKKDKEELEKRKEEKQKKSNINVEIIDEES